MKFLKRNLIDFLKRKSVSCKMWAATGGTVLYLAVTSRVGMRGLK